MEWAHAQWLRHLPPGRELLPDQHLAQGGPGRPAKPRPSTSAATPTSRRMAPTAWCRACGRGETTASRAARHRRCGGQVPDPHGQGDGRPAHRPAGRPKEEHLRADLNAARLVSGHAYSKGLRTVKTCVGSELCRFGTQDSTELGIQLERALGGDVAPHKVKLAVSGCPRNCAECGIKDIGVIGVDQGFSDQYRGRPGGVKDRGAGSFTAQAAEEVSESSGPLSSFTARNARYLDRPCHWVAKVGLDRVKARIADVENRRALVRLRAQSIRLSPRPLGRASTPAETPKSTPCRSNTGGFRK